MSAPDQQTRIGLVAGPAMAAGGSLFVLISTFVHEEYGYSYWSYSGKGEAVLLLLLALIGLAGAVISFLAQPVIGALMALFAGLVALGAELPFPVQAHSHLGAALPLGILGSLLLGLGAGWCLLDTRVIDVRSALQVAPVARGLARVRPPTAQPRAPDGVPAGWYPDPSGQARLRYWDGQQWRADTQQ